MTADSGPVSQHHRPAWWEIAELLMYTRLRGIGRNLLSTIKVPSDVDINLARAIVHDRSEPAYPGRKKRG